MCTLHNGLEQLALYQCRKCRSLFLFSNDKERHASDTGHNEFEEMDMDNYTLR
jgi:hypothetical protein